MMEVNMIDAKTARGISDRVKSNGYLDMSGKWLRKINSAITNASKEGKRSVVLNVVDHHEVRKVIDSELLKLGYIVVRNGDEMAWEVRW
jgi:hypothetical protein